ncbi:hypothetical protein A3A79_01980 [Candidatus Gottesmanbacteria bacterium RIFCSPLOWO2_01_FULL_43_11b]|uniref:Methyltransferase type 11 domain-containing protein n=1 Tax=Candidatus Gottesmanbacteria bacterium RIFCSPLOWO2_01_FULL_43_11b TaxID=1798392 RepID=A0A1F6AGS2_9BACT|nr:MAG: hypothetical protein A3A79_01980 [Candidatus Gottesmanbacteria bacterium RIFCSPLOWO2_01_FULL_43_11b]
MSKTYKTSHYDLIVKMEREHFWFQSRNRLLAHIVDRFIPKRAGKTFLEVGFGTGVVLAQLASLGLNVEGVDVNAEAVSIAKRRVHAKFYRSSLYSFIPGKQYDAIGAFDVLEHQSDDRKFLAKCYQLLKPNGLLFLTAPSGMWLWNSLDEYAGHKRRYEISKLLDVVNKAGFNVLYWNYWQMFTLPFFIIFRSRKKKLSEYLSVPPKIINSFFLFLSYLELPFFLRFRFPIGSSIVLIARAGLPTTTV